MTLVTGREAAVWDARAEVEVGVLILRYLQERPAPPDAGFRRDFEEWGQRLARSGRERLADLGERHLSPAGPA